MANPNNPTGTCFNNEQQLSFLEKVPKNILVIIDEAYSEFVSKDFDFPKTLEHMKTYENVMLLKTFSKAYGLASLRVGFGIAKVNIISLFEKIRNPFNVSVPAQIGSAKALEDYYFIDYTHMMNLKVMDIMKSCFETMNLFYIPSHTNFIMVDTKISSKLVFNELMKKGFIIRPGLAFGMDTFIRISLGTLEEMSQFLVIFKEILRVNG